MYNIIAIETASFCATIWQHFRIMLPTAVVRWNPVICDLICDLIISIQHDRYCHNNFIVITLLSSLYCHNNFTW